MSDTSTKFESWAKVELFGHTVIVGKVTEATLGGCSFVRVDVPEHGGRASFTKFFGNGAIYAMTPVTEEVALRLLNTYNAAPIRPYELPALPAPTADDEKEEGEF